MSDGSPVGPRLRRWQVITAATLFIGYAGYYVCRSNLSVATPALLAEYSAQEWTKEDIGWVASAGIVAYFVGKIVNGVLADVLGGRLLFLTGMFVSVACTVLFGLSSGLTAFTVIWVVNRFVQSMGWVAMVQISARWYSHTVHATVMGVLSMSYLLGDAGARLYLGGLLRLGIGWRELFFLAAATLGVLGVGALFTLKEGPAKLNLPEPPASPTAGSTEESAPGLLGRLGPLLRNPAFWMVCLINAGLTLIRETLNFWTPTYLHEVAGMDRADAALGSMVVPLVGAVAALVSGAASDRFRGRRAGVMMPSLLALIVMLLVPAVAPVAGRPWLALPLLGGIALTLLGPYSFCSGVIPLDLGGKRSGSTAAGLIDAGGYCGAVASGYGVGRLAQSFGWEGVFACLAGVAVLTTLATAFYWLALEGRRT